MVLATEYLPRIVGLRAGNLVYDGPAKAIDEHVLTQIYGAEDWTSITKNLESVQNDLSLKEADNASLEIA